MAIWLVEYFGSRELNTLFWVATASSAPFWLLMLVWPRSRLTNTLCRLWLAPPLLGVFYLYLFYLAYDVTGLPRLEGVEMKNVRRFWAHPILFIALWMHRLTMDLFVGIWISRFARFRGWEVRFELVLVWLLGPIGTLFFAARYWVATLIGKWRSRKEAVTEED
ncbi:ABA4-like family protein [Pelagicoccus sp. SDUM812005]|uniref:ABA4-like family protein n=1 Tax=Pelagicoccus sp. SDUM812005 TaxID=3041257 RepID=UPI00280DF62B|nr:ABA4-like family protein [Pelagicoccus sp. SDUM812005]MDQ8180741.1 ABA4-like family protein [Pelagicoccus sp. SDUM812005]